MPLDLWGGRRNPSSAAAPLTFLKGIQQSSGYCGRAFGTAPAHPREGGGGREGGCQVPVGSEDQKRPRQIQLCRQLLR